MSAGYLLDSHVMLWLALEDRRLSGSLTDILGVRSTPLFVSTAGIAELCIKASLGKLQLPFTPGETAEAGFSRLLGGFGAAPLDVTLAHGARLRDLPMHHRDPFDRLMIAQAMVEDLTLVTHDRMFARYDGLAVLWA